MHADRMHSPLSSSQFTLQVATEQSVAFFCPWKTPAALHHPDYPRTGIFQSPDVAAQEAALQRTRGYLPQPHTLASRGTPIRQFISRHSTTSSGSWPPTASLAPMQQGPQTSRHAGLAAHRIKQDLSASPMPAPCPDGPAAPTKARPGCGSAHRCAECAA